MSKELHQNIFSNFLKTVNKYSSQFLLLALLITLTSSSLSLINPFNSIKAQAATPAACTSGGTTVLDHSGDPLCAGKVQYRVIYKSIDCGNNTADFEVQVKSDSAYPQPIMGDFNIRFNYDATVMKRLGTGNQSLVAVNKYGNGLPASNTDYGAQNLNGSQENATNGTMSLNGFFSNLPGTVIPTTFTTISTIRMNIVNPAGGLNIDMNDHTSFPTTGNNVPFDDGLGSYDLIEPAYETANIDLVGSTKNALCTVAPTGITATDDNYTATGTTPVTLTPLTGDSGTGIIIKSINGTILVPGTVQTINTTYGKVITTALGVIKYSPNGVSATDTFPYVIQDSTGATATANEVVTVAPTFCSLIDTVVNPLQKLTSVTGNQTIATTTVTLPNQNDFYPNFGGIDGYLLGDPNFNETLPLTFSKPITKIKITGVALSNLNTAGVIDEEQFSLLVNGSLHTFVPANFTSIQGGVAIMPSGTRIKGGQFNNTGDGRFEYILDVPTGIGSIELQHFNIQNVGAGAVYQIELGGNILTCVKAIDDNYTTNGTTPVTLAPLTGDTAGTIIKSINGINLVGGIQSIPVTNGTVNVDAAGAITFTANAGYTGLVQFPYVIQDTGGQTATANEIINIKPKTGDICINKIKNGSFVDNLVDWNAGNGWVWNNGTAALATDGLTNDLISQPVFGYVNSGGTTTFRIELQPAEANNLTTFGANLDVSFGGTKYLTISNPIGTGDVTYVASNGAIYTVDTTTRNQLATIYLTVPSVANTTKTLEFNHVSGDDDWYIYNVATDVCVTPPTAVNDNYTTTGVTPVTLTPLTGDTAGTTIKSINSIDLTPGIAQTITVPNGTVTIDIAGVIKFTPNTGFVGDVTFPYVIQDANGNTATANEKITVSAPLVGKLELIKKATLVGTGIVGDKINYTFEVKNVGNVTISDVKITDAKCTVTGTLASLAPLASDTTTFSCSYTITQADVDLGKVENTATVTGKDPKGKDIKDVSDSNDPTKPGTDDITVTPITSNLKLEVIKKATLAGTGITGDKINYTFEVKNIGNVTISDIVISDTKCTVTGTLASLAPLASDTTTFTCSYTITQADVDAGKVENTATVTGKDPKGGEVKDVSDSIDPTKPGTDDITAIVLPPTKISISLTDSSNCGGLIFGNVVYNTKNAKIKVTIYKKGTKEIVKIFTPEIQNNSYKIIVNYNDNTSVNYLAEGEYDLEARIVDDLNQNAIYTGPYSISSKCYPIKTAMMLARTGGELVSGNNDSLTILLTIITLTILAGISVFKKQD